MNSSDIKVMSTKMHYSLSKDLQETAEYKEKSAALKRTIFPKVRVQNLQPKKHCNIFILLCPAYQPSYLSRAMENINCRLSNWGLRKLSYFRIACN